ncbi:InlB B-repeat-containing protein, partial [Candidatus Saccharibacteria bacterium]|nr:InlB B-repeat-containing protein [Candidatus Saccharibacteria bacterium]
VNVSTAKTPGTYGGEVLYTVLMNDACLKYTLNFNGNSATTNTLTSQDLTFDSTIDLSTISDSTKIARTGYTLTGWKDQNNNEYGTSGTADVNPSDLSSVTLTAQWQINSNNVTVSKGTNVTTTSGTGTYDYNSTVTISATTFSTGYHFSGWTVNSGGVTLYSNSSMTTASTTSTPAYFKMPDNDVKVTANAAANTYTIKYNNGGGSGTAPSSQTGTYGGTITTRANTFSRTGYQFAGWSTTNSASSATCSASASCSVSTLASNAGVTGTNGATINLYAVWTPNTVTITYSANGGTGSASKTSETGYYGTNITMPTKGTLAKSGADFLGWSLSSTATSATWTAGQTSVNPTAINSSLSSSTGLSTTVYAVWKSSTATMQSFTCANSGLSTGQSTTLVDSRDQKEYTVKKLPDGKCWMMQNLTINGVKLTSSDTNFTSGGPYYLPKDGGAGSLTASATKNSTTGYNFTNGQDNKAMFKFRAKKSSYTNDSDTGYYNFYTATLGFSYYGDGKSTGTSDIDICPKNWRLPKVSATATTTSGSRDFTGDFAVLANSYNTSASWTNGTTANRYTSDTTIKNAMYLQAASPLATSTQNNYAGFSYSGVWLGADSSASNLGSDGYYWSSSVYNTNFGYILYFDSSYVYPQNYSYKYRGYAVRCVAKS